MCTNVCVSIAHPISLYTFYRGGFCPLLTDEMKRKFLFALKKLGDDDDHDDDEGDDEDDHEPQGTTDDDDDVKGNRCERVK